jgi:hypothetical protein
MMPFSSLWFGTLTAADHLARVVGDLYIRMAISPPR